MVPMCDDREVTALACSLLASILMNLAMLYWRCSSPADDALPEIDELLGATLLDGQPETNVFDRGDDRIKSSESQTDQEI